MRLPFVDKERSPTREDAMNITLQYFDGCPNWETTERHLATLIDEMNLEASLAPSADRVT